MAPLPRARCLTAKPREHEGHCTAGVGALLYIHQCALTNAARFGTAFCGETGYAPGCQQQQLEHADYVATRDVAAMPCHRSYAALRLLIAALQLQAIVNAAQPTRRRALVGGLASAAVPTIAQARVRGAAELDAEYYARRAFEKVTNTSPDVFDARRARAAPVAAAARPVDAALLAAVRREGATALAAASGASARTITDAIAAREPAARKAFAARAARDLDAGDATSDSAGVAVLALYEEAAERLLDKKSRTAFATAFGAALLASRGPAPAPGASFKSLIKATEDTLAAWKAAGWTKDAKITFESGADLAEAADDFASGYEVKTSVALGGAASCLADACLEERGIAWHPDPCCLALASWLAQSNVALATPTPHCYDEFLLDDVYRDDPRAFLPSTLLGLFVVAKS